MDGWTAQKYITLEYAVFNSSISNIVFKFREIERLEYFLTAYYWFNENCKSRPGIKRKFITIFIGDKDALVGTYWNNVRKKGKQII